MRDLMKFGIVLVVLAMATGIAFAATQEYDGDDLDTWFDDDNWRKDDVTPRLGKKDDVEVDNGNTVVIDPSPAQIEDGHPAELDELIIINGGVQVGTSIANGDAADIYAYLRVDRDLEMADSGSSDYAILDIVNGYVYVEDKSEDLFEDGSGEITIADIGKLKLDDGAYLGHSSDGADSVYTFDIAGIFQIKGNRLEHEGGQLIINLTGDGLFEVEKTSRLSMDDDSVVTVNINTAVADENGEGGDEDGEAVCKFDKIELNKNDDGIHDDFTYSLEINIGGNGTWDGGGEELKDSDDGAIVNINVTGNGTFITKDLNINDDDSEINITMDSGTIDIEDDIDMEAGDIVITGGTFDVDDDFEFGDGKKAATMTVSGTADVWIDDLYMAKKSKLTINSVRLDLDDLKDTDDFDGSIEINGDGELVIKNADDQEDLDEINDLIDDGDITTSDPGKYIIADYGISHSGKLTVQAVYPFEVDIKPGGCGNPLRVNFQGRGVITVAIVGSDTFDVTTDVDPDTVTLLGVPALRSAFGDVSTAGDCASGTDGNVDLILKFRRADVLEALEDLYGDLTELPNRAELSIVVLGDSDDGVVGGTDSLNVLNRGSIRRSRR